MPCVTVGHTSQAQRLGWQQQAGHETERSPLETVYRYTRRMEHFTQACGS